MMRIVICGPAHPYRGGIAAYNERLAQQLLQEGDAAAIYTFKLQYPSFLFPGKSQYDHGYAPEGVPITRAINSVNPSTGLISGFVSDAPGRTLSSCGTGFLSSPRRWDSLPGL
jgi:D-inositol-3-phosphate glycosyltransferase